jgi:hypothetical protein
MTLYYFLKLLPPRPTFQQDMTPEERDVMSDHVRYWTELAERGAAIAFGPVADAEHTWDVGIIEVATPQECLDLASNDPAIQSGLGFTTNVTVMPRIVLRPTLTRPASND